jgi:hypothetical protein
MPGDLFPDVFVSKRQPTYQQFVYLPSKAAVFPGFQSLCYVCLQLLRVEGRPDHWNHGFKIRMANRCDLFVEDSLYLLWVVVFGFARDKCVVDLIVDKRILQRPMDVESLLFSC